MKTILLSLTFVLGVLFAFGQEAGKNFIDQNYIEVKGQGELEITPDRIYLKIQMNDKDFKGKNLPEVEKEMIDKLQEIGIDISKDLVINDLVSNYKYYWFQKTDILMAKEYQLLVHDAKTLGMVYTELASLGISNISISKLDHREIEKYRGEVKVKAIKDAKEKADALAHALGQEIGRALYMSEYGNGFEAHRVLTGAVSGIRVRGAKSTVYGSAAQPDIEFEKMKLEYEIMVRFELK